jgi:hypothetical protein
MQLREARLCLDCEELHTDPQCPICASESFAFLTRWVPAEERRLAARQPPRPPRESSRKSTWAKRSATGLALLAVTRLLWNSTRPDQPARPVPPDGE